MSLVQVGFIWWVWGRRWPGSLLLPRWGPLVKTLYESWEGPKKGEIKRCMLNLVEMCLVGAVSFPREIIFCF